MFINIHEITYFLDISGIGTPILLLHGFTGSSANWQPIAEQLAAHYQVITLDLPGHGKTDSPADVQRYQMPQVAADVVGLLDQVTTPPVHLLGYSMGGRLALYLAMHYPQYVRSLILESASPGLADPQARANRQESDAQLANRIEQIGIPAFIDEWEQHPIFATQQHLPESVQAQHRQQRLQNTAKGLANSLRGMGTGVQPPLWDRLADIQMPTLLLAGALDSKFVGIAQQMHAQLPDSQLAIVPAAGHTIHLEQPAAYLKVIQNFLAED